MEGQPSADLHVCPIPVERTQRLRHAVLRPHQTLADVTAAEAVDAFAVGGFDGGKLVAVGLVASDGGPGSWRVRGMATAPDARRRGAGTLVLAELLRRAWSEEAVRVWCNARVAARSLYERGGLRVVSEEFELPGIGPHLRMELSRPETVAADGPAGVSRVDAGG